MSDDSYQDDHPARHPRAFMLDEKRRRVLSEIDGAPFSWFHVKICLVAGVGFFTDAYDIFAVGIAVTMIGYVYGTTSSSHPLSRALTYRQELGIKVATPVGNVVGQLFFGWLADVLGRKRMYGIELIIIMTATFGQAMSGSGPAMSIVGAIVVWRFIMGVGIGGDYPLSAIISSEFAAVGLRGKLMTAVFAFQGWGNLCAALVSLVVLTAYKDSIIGDTMPDLNHVDYLWRLVIGLGCIPCALAIYFRLTIPETPRFTLDVNRNVAQAAQDVENVLSLGTFYHNPDEVFVRVHVPQANPRDFARYFSNWDNFKVLFGAAYSWFAIDIAYYGLGLNTSSLWQAMGFASANPQTSSDAFQALRNICVANIITSVAGLIPGYWVSFLFIDSWGRRPIQLMGFSVLTVLFAIMGFAYEKLIATPSSRGGLMFLFCLANFFSNFGPNTTTFIIPGEAFPTRYRSTAHGISAASGKIGAIIAQVCYNQLKDLGGPNKFVKHIFEIFAVFMITGIFSTLLIPETKERSLEDISNENQQGFVSGVIGAAQEPREPPMRAQNRDVWQQAGDHLQRIM
ncbi:hypothetical protein JAAARDRAFT_203751 [Jaapia argillacea MUCL 33604]|uniref:Major facilitator superfamily (MFS) profile domain-containing protein n=1 Tax=Jaapia argillacea MUCL 33604 TaxID=933084 RepID=A0A067Q6S3_9AGAM|nr:hypothetical protein JAAARDRAFT_203751 [Jaapia argillacea MUCL 33604]